jgi:Transcriptional regulator
MDRLKSMAVFVKVVEYGSFSSAGEAMTMSSQLVGKHIQSLEQHLGTSLINRTTRRQHLTEAGRVFYERVKVILSEVESAESLVAIRQGAPRGLLRVNAPVSFGIHALSKSLPDYLMQNPDVSVDMSLSNRNVDIIEEGFDIAFRVGELPDSGLVARQLSPYRLILCAAPSYFNNRQKPRHPDDLRMDECLSFSFTEQRTKWTFMGPEGMIIVPVNGRLMIDTGEALLNAARAGLGLLYQPEELVKDDLNNGQLIEVLPDYPIPVRPFHILYAPDRRMTPKLRSFIDFVMERFGPDTKKSKPHK